MQKMWGWGHALHQCPTPALVCHLCDGHDHWKRACINSKNTISNLYAAVASDDDVDVGEIDEHLGETDADVNPLEVIVRGYR